MKISDLVVATVIGGGPEEYDFLLGSIDYHRQLAGTVLIWETGPEPSTRPWPEGVVAVHRPIYGAGPAAFDYGRALDDATAYAVENTPAATLARVDADEYLPANIELAVKAARAGRAARIEMVHHLNPYWAAHVPGQSRAVVWPLRGQGGAPLMRHIPSGIPPSGAFHPMPVGPRELYFGAVRLQHLRFAIGRKAAERPTYWINGGWSRARIEEVRDPWPAPFMRWREESRKPTEDPDAS